ncbi:hypothetical protein ACSBPU_02445 [Parapusillimonas sp. JC17]|uniref:hypothetical protein n=1 Tax=Parapusillimonas sp. JC17 TaxID=3445768 RepID=UPI003FA08CB8
MTTTAETTDISYPLSTNINIVFSAYEDRLIVNAERPNHGPVHMLLTRRMTMIVLHQLLTKLPELTGLDQTPAEYWQEVLQMAHQKAMQAKRDTDQAAEESASLQAGDSERADAAEATATEAPVPIYLATELIIKLDDKQLILAFKGLPMPQAMTQASAHEPVFAMPLSDDHVHQLIELLIKKAQDAQWHLPLDLPWLDSPEPQATTLGVLLH